MAREFDARVWRLAGFPLVLRRTGPQSGNSNKKIGVTQVNTAKVCNTVFTWRVSASAPCYEFSSSLPHSQGCVLHHVVRFSFRQVRFVKVSMQLNPFPAACCNSPIFKLPSVFCVLLLHQYFFIKDNFTQTCTSSGINDVKWRSRRRCDGIRARALCRPRAQPLYNDLERSHGRRLLSMKL